MYINSTNNKIKETICFVANLSAACIVVDLLRLCFVVNLLRQEVGLLIVSFFVGFCFGNSNDTVGSKKVIRLNHVRRYAVDMKS